MTALYSNRRAIASSLIVAGLLLAPGTTAHAASDTWIGFTDSLWSATTNWASGNVPGTGDTATFNGAGGGNTTIDLGTGVTLGALVFDTADVAAYTIGSGAVGSQTLTLGTTGNAITMSSTVAANQLFNSNLALSVTASTTASTDSGTHYTVANNSTMSTLTLAGGISASTTGTKVLAVTGSGNTTISGAISSGSGAMNLVKTGTGTLTLSGGAALGTGTINDYGGTNSAVLLGGTTNISSGTYTSTGEFVVGGVLSAGGTGVDTKLTMDGGSLTISNNAWLSLGRGNGIGSVSSDIVLNNNASITTVNFGAGFNNGSTANLPKGTFTLNGTSSFTTSGSFFLSESQGANMTMTLNDTSTVAANGTSAKYIGKYSGNGTLIINGGAFTSGGEVRVAGSDNNNSAYTGTGTMTLNSGSVTVASLTVNRGNNNQFAGTGVVNVNGGTLTSSGTVTVSFAGASSSTGTLNVAGGTFNVGTTAATKLIVNQYDPANANVNVTGGNLNLNSNSSINFTEVGNGTSVNTFTMSGGAVTYYSDNATTVGGTGVLNLANAGASAYTNTFNLNGGVLTVPRIMSGTTNGTRIFNFNGGTLKAATDGQTLMSATAASRANVRDGGAIVDTNGKSVTIAAALQHSNIADDSATDGGLTKNGSGTLTLSGVNTYTGLTSISAGTLTLASTGSITNSSTISVGSGATFDVSAVSGYAVALGQTLKGTGTVVGNVTVSGTFAPGNSPGTLNVTGDLTLAGITEMEIGASAYDQAIATGTLTYGGALNIVSFEGYNLAQAGSYNLFDAGTSLTGSFSAVSVAGTALLLTADGYSSTFGGFTYTFTNADGMLNVTASAIPEPSTYAAIVGALALAGVVWQRRRRAGAAVQG